MGEENSSLYWSRSDSQVAEQAANHGSLEPSAEVSYHEASVLQHNGSQSNRPESQHCSRLSSSQEPRPIVVTFGWMYSQKRHLAAYAKLYNANGWNALLCHPPVLNLWFPQRALSLARQVLEVLHLEVGSTARPILFAAFSGGCKACLYKLLQELENCPEKYAVLRRSFAGLALDSCPIDFVSAIGVKFLSDPPGRVGQPSWLRHAAATAAVPVLDFFFLSAFEAQRAQFWSALTAWALKGPVIVFYCQSDVLAPHERITQFIADVTASGGHVTGVFWNKSEHVGHLRQHPQDYEEKFRTFLAAAQRRWRDKIGGMCPSFSEGDESEGENTRPTLPNLPSKL